MKKKFFLFVFLSLFFAFQAECRKPLFTIRSSSKYKQNISNKDKYVWFRMPKAGSCTIVDILKDHTDLSIIQCRFSPKRHANYFKFVFVRNPWDRVVSCYYNKVVSRLDDNFEECFDQDFDYFVDFIDRQDLDHADEHIRLQTRLFPVEHVDFIGRFENFEEDLRFVLDRLGVGDVNIPKKNATRHRHYSEYYSERTKEIIARKYQVDIETLGYEFSTF